MRLEQAEVCEHNPHYRDDLAIARLTVIHASTGKAVLCGPHVLATYEVLGLHPDKVWPAIQARRAAIVGKVQQSFWRDFPPKKPPVSAVGKSHVKLWCEKANGARAVNSRAGEASDLGDQTRRLLMAAPSIAALYPNPSDSSSAKKRQFTLGELIEIVRYSGAPVSVRDLTLAALQARGPWPKNPGPATPVISVSIKGMQIEAGVVRSTIQRRIKRARREQYWRRVRETNSWNECPKCESPREASKCGKCGYQGSRKNKGEFSPAFTYEIDVQRFLTAPRCREIHSVDWRTYAEYKAAAKRGEHPNVTEMPRKPAQPVPDKVPDPPATAKPAAEDHRGTVRAETPRPEPKPAQPKLTRRECAKFMANVQQLIRGRTSYFSRADGLNVALHPGEDGYREKLPWDAAFDEECKNWHREKDAVLYALKFWGYKLQE